MTGLPYTYTAAVRGTAFVLRHEGLARHYLRQEPNGGMSHQNIVMSIEQIWAPNTGDKSNRGDGTGETLASDAKGWVDKRASGARMTHATPQHRPKRPNTTNTNTRKGQHKVLAAQKTLGRGRQRRGHNEPYGP